MTDNLALWKSVEKTDPNHVKAITGKSYQGTSPKPHYLVHKATETFGPIGIGWGFTIEDERIEEGAGGTRMHIARVKVWFKWNGERGEVEHIGGTEFSGTRASGKAFTDEDAPKKSVTDALVKALSMIGFAGDIFMGRYDDSKYVNDLKNEVAATAEPVAQPSKYLDHFDAINTAADLDTLQKAFLAAKADKSLTKQEAGDLIKEKDRRKAVLTKPAVAPNFDDMETEIPFATRQAAEGLRV